MFDHNRINQQVKRYIDSAVSRSEKNIVNYSAEAKSAEELSDGVTKIYPNTVAKTVVFETIVDNSFKTVTLDPGAGSIALKNGSISGISDVAGNDSTVALSQRALIDVQDQIDKKADKDHTHTISDITDYEPYDDTEVRTLIDNRMQVTSYSTLDEVMNNWRSITYPSIVFTDDGPESYTSTIIIKQNGSRSLCISSNKSIRDHIWIKFQGTDGKDTWNNSSPWRKIPVLDTTDNIICNNVKADNETRLKTLEVNINDKSDKDHVHNINDIEGYEQYDDTEVRTLINNKIPVISYNTMDELMSNWKNITSPSVLFASDGPEQYTSTIVIKQNDSRSLCLSMNKNEHDYIWLRFQGKGSDNDWTNASPWRKIPLLDTTDNIVCNNVKADNEDRIKVLESKFANMIDMFYPVGSIYTSMNNTSPETLFGGTWTQITDRFLYCANSSKQTGGSKKITVDNMPSHNHAIESVYDDCNYNHDSHREDPFFEISEFNSIPTDVTSESEIYIRRTTYTDSTGNGADYMPPYITVFCWYRTA